MLSVAEATRAVLGRARPLPSRRFSLGDAGGLVLAEPVVADLDLPPFDKALMDGYAIRAADLDRPGWGAFRVVGEVVAGQSSDRPLAEGEAIRIMTGAPLPPGADAVVMVERSRAGAGGTVLLEGPAAPGLARLVRGREMRAGECLLSPGDRLGPARLGLVASAGRSAILATPRPAVRVVPTGDELVPIDHRPGPGQIRNTNGVMLAGLASAWGARDVLELPVAPDEPEGLRATLRAAFDGADVVLVSGGVSAGTRDLVPEALVELGVEPVFHKVRVKPGKPIWFGILPRGGDGPDALVFGLPGNPVSGLVGFLLFVRPALEALAGLPANPARLLPATLAAPFQHRGDRPTYHPARLDGDRATPIEWAGSSDLRTAALADGFILFPERDRAFREGEPVSFLPH